ncbi:L,D-transpeptidase family protein [Gellertiella hungarica]|uniref:L,D-TPase catalytic domain-containing protein n=1 Tax=Gellertiella hungarica TaxID=1572859 RepID=A0A7W6J8D8_9HYPH|nr:L,D-transpeptidase family protein [Gellertiella hungarica]MBB4066701.1 hypothetical protein [Gellertiella hungarica]
MLYRLVVGLGTALLLTAPAHAGSSRALAIVVSRDNQSLAVYDGDKVVATSNVSTGKPGHSTPTGIFTVIEKKKYHESNLYDSAPMPFMQRITWSGVALHESKSVPRRPASHGCVRLPHGFAKELYGMTDMGVPVIIADEALVPQALLHPFLFKPERPSGGDTLLSDAELRLSPISDFLKPTEVALNEASIAPPREAKQDEDKALRILVTRRGLSETIKDVQAALNGLGFSAGEPDGRLGRNTIAAINAFKLTRDMPVKGNVLTEEVVDAIFKAAGKERPPEGQIYVRRNFKPLFDAPVVIAEPEVALGTHVMQLRDMNAATGAAEWYGMTVPDGLSAATRKRLGIASDALSLQETMNRIRIPDAVRERIEAELTAGSLITITDGGLGQETGTEGTDFITLTHPPKSGG